jgi:hypothetical protein
MEFEIHYVQIFAYFARMIVDVNRPGRYSAWLLLKIIQTSIKKPRNTFAGVRRIVSVQALIIFIWNETDCDLRPMR